MQLVLFESTNCQDLLTFTKLTEYTVLKSFKIQHKKLLKVGCVIFQKPFRKPSRGRVPKNTGSQSAVRGVSTHDVEERGFREQLSRVTER